MTLRLLLTSQGTVTNSGHPVDGADGRRGRPASQHNKRNNVVEGQLEMIFMPWSSLPRVDGHKGQTREHKYRRAQDQAGEVQREGEAGPGRA